MPWLARFKILLQANRVGAHGEGTRFVVDAHGYVPLARFEGKNAHGIGDDFVEVEFLQLDRAAPLYQLSQVPADVDGVHVGLANIR